MIANRTLTLMAAVAAAGVSGWAPSSAHALTNLLANPGFENGAGGGSLSGWGAFSNAYAEGTSTGVPTRTGDGVAKMFGSFNGGFGVSGVFQQFPTTPGTTFQMHVFSRQNTGDALVGTDNWAVEKIAFFDAANAEITSAAVEAHVMDATFALDTWVDNTTITATAPAGAVSVQPLLLFLQPTGKGGAALFDDASFGVVPEPASMTFVIGAAAGLVARRPRR